MTCAEFYKKDGEVTGFKVKGHSDYADIGSDVVCAGVTSAVNITANYITEIFGFEADVSAVGDTVSLKTHTKGDDTLQKLYQGLILQLRMIAEKYNDNVKLIFTEV